MKRRELQALCKRHGLPAGGTNADLAARLAAALPGAAGPEEGVVAARKGCLKRSDCGGDAGDAKKVTFALEEEGEASGRRLRSRVIWSPVVAKTRGRRKGGETLPAKQARGRGRPRKLVEVTCDSADDDGVAGEVGADPPARRTRRNAGNSGATDGAEGGNNSGMAGEEREEVAREAVDRKRKRKTPGNAEDIATNALDGVSRRVTRRSSLLASAVLLPHAAEKKRGRRKARDSKDEEHGADVQASEVQDFAGAGSPVLVESKRSRRKGEDCVPAEQRSPKVEASFRTTKSRSVASAAMLPTAVDNKRRKKEYGQPDGNPPTVLELPRNDAPVTRSLRNRVFQVINNVVEDTQIGKKENKRQPSGPATCTHQQLAFSVDKEDQEQVAAPSKCPPLRRSGRNHSEATSANSEPEAKDLTIARSLTCHDAKGEDLEKQPAVRRTTRKSVVSAIEKEEKDLGAEKNPEAQARKSLRRSVVPAVDTKVVGEEIQNGKGEDATKQAAVKEPVRRVTRNSVVSAMLGKEKDLITEKNPEAHVRRSMRKSVVPVVDIKSVSDETQNAKVEDVENQPAVKEPVRRSTRKSVVLAMLEKEKDLNVEKNPEAHVRKSTRKSVVPVKDNRSGGEEIQNAGAEYLEKQPVVKQPVRRSSRKSVLPDMLENESGLLVAEMNDEVHIRRSLRKSILPNMLNKENKDHSKTAMNHNFQNDKCGDEEKQQTLKEPVTRSRRSVAALVVEEVNKGIREEKESEIPMRRSTRKSVTLNAVEKGSRDHTEIVGRKQLRVVERNLRARVQLTDAALSVATSENKLQDNQGSLQSACKCLKHNVSYDDKAHPGPGEYISCERVGEEGLRLRKRRRDSVAVSSPANDCWNTKAFGGQNFRKQQNTQTRNEKENTGTDHVKPPRSQLVPNSMTSKGRPAKRRRTTVPQEVISAEEIKSDDVVISEAMQDGIDVARECSKESTSKGQEICQVNATGDEFSSASLLATLPEKTCLVQSVREVIPGSESSDVDQWCQTPEVHHSRAMESSDKCKLVQEHSNIQTDDSHLPDTRIGEVDQSSSSAELVRHVGFVRENETSMDEGEVRLDAKGIQIVNAGSCEVGLEMLTKPVDIGQEIRLTTAVHILDAEAPLDEGATVNLEDEDVLPIVEKTVCGEENATESAGNTLSDIMSTSLHAKDLELDCVRSKETGEASEPALPISDGKPEFHCDAIAEEGIRDAYLEECLSKGSKGTPLSTDLHSEGAADNTLNAAKGCSSDGRRSSFGLKSLFAEECKESNSRNDENAAVEIDCGNKSSPRVTPSFFARSNCGLEHEDVQHIGYDADKEPDVDQGVEQEEVVAEKSNDVIDLETKLNEEQGMIQVQQSDVKEGTLEKRSLCSATPECKLERGLEHEDVQHIGYDADKEPDVDQGVEQEEVVAERSNDELIDLETKLNDETVGLYMESDCSLAEENVRLVADNPNDEQAMVQVQQIGVKEGTLEKHSLCSATPECKLEGGLHEEAVPHSMKNKGCLSNAKQSLFDQHSLFAQESIEESMEYGALASETVHTESEFGELKDCHVNCATGKTPLSERISHHEGSLEVSYEEERVSSSVSGFSVDANLLKNVVNLEEVAGSGEGSRKTVHSDDLIASASCKKSDVNEPDICTIGNPSFDLATPDYKHEGALSEEAVRTIKNYAGTCLSNPRKLLTELQYLLTEGNAEGSSSRDGHAFPSAESRGDESTVCHEQYVLSEPGTYQGLADVSNILEDGSVAGIVGKATPCCSGLPKDSSTDRYLQQKVLDDSLMEKSLEESTMFADRSDCIVGNTGNSSLGLAVSDCKHEGALPVEAVDIMKNYVGSCSSDPKELLRDLQSLISDENVDEADWHDTLASPSAESGEDFRRAEENEACKFVSKQDNEKGLQSSHKKEWDTSAKVDLSEAAHQTERNIIAEEVLREETEKRMSMPTFDSDTLHEKSRSTGCAGKAYCSSETQFYSSQKTSSRPSSAPLESPNALDNLILGSNTRVLQQHHKEEYYERNEDQVTSGIHVMSEAAPIKVLDSGVGPVQAVDTSAVLDEQLNPELEDDKVEQHSFIFTCEKGSSDVLDSPSVMVISHFPKGTYTTYDQEQELHNNLSAPKSHETSAICQDGSVSGSGICQSSVRKHIEHFNSKLSSCTTEALHQDHKMEHNVLNENKVTPGVPENDMSEAVSFPVEGMESAIAILPVGGTSELPNEQLNLMLEGDGGEEHSFSCDKDTSEISCTGSAKNDLSHMLEDCHMDSCQKQGVPDGLPVPKSPEESANCQDIVLGSGPFQQSGQKYINEGSTKQLNYNAELLNQYHEECNENNEDQITPGIPVSSVSEAVKIERSEREIDLTPAGGTSAMPDDHMSKLEDNGVEKQNFSCDKYTSSLFDTKFVENSKTSNLPKDAPMDPSSEHKFSNDQAAPRSPQESTTFQNDSIFGPVGISQSNRQRVIDEISTKLQSFKVSSTVKGSYIGMCASRTKQGDNNLSQSALCALLRNVENTPSVKAGHPFKPNNDRSAAKDSSRRALQPISGRPRDH
ncbi:hypothetical protein ACP70R_020010 [Stipagrostis hirtigluma subsp. patula]